MRIHLFVHIYTSISLFVFAFQIWSRLTMPTGCRTADADCTNTGAMCRCTGDGCVLRNRKVAHSDELADEREYQQSCYLADTAKFIPLWNFVAPMLSASCKCKNE